MPLYEFECRECEKTFETLIRSEKELAETACPECSSAKVERLLSVPARPTSDAASELPMGGACGSGPPCGAPWCQRPGN